MRKKDQRTFNEKVITTIVSAPGSEDWNSWDDAYHWVSEHPRQVGGRGIAWRFMEALERAQRHGVPFTRDPERAVQAVLPHLGSIEQVHARGT
jgi:hypothetical protein